MKRLTALLILLLSTSCYAQVGVSNSSEKFYFADSATVYDAGGKVYVKAKSLNSTALGTIDVVVKNREKYSDPVGISSIGGVITMRNTIKLEKDFYILVGNPGEVWTILITVIKDGIPVNEFSEPIKIEGDVTPEPQPQPPLSDVAQKIADIGKGMTAKDREAVSRLYDSIVAKVDAKEFTTVGQISSYISGYQITIENQSAWETFKEFVKVDVPPRKLDVKGFRNYCAEIVKGLRSVSPDVEPDGTSPFAEAGLRVLIVYESGDVTQYTREHLEILGSIDFRTWLDSKVVKDPQGQSEYRILDPNDMPTGIWANVMNQPRQSLPWIYIGNGKTGYSGPLPANLEETKSLISKYSG